MASGLGPSKVLAEEVRAEADTDTLVITGQQNPEATSLTEVNLERYTGFAQTLNRADFGDRLTNFSDLINRMPGMQVNQMGGLGSYQTLSVRGSTGKQVNVFLDGLLLTSPASGAGEIQYIPSVLIESVTAYPDFTPIELGNANLAGAINFVTRRHLPDDSIGEFSTAYGSFNTQNNEVSAWGTLQDWQVIGGLSLLSTDNDYSLDQAARDAMRTPYDERLNNAYDQHSAFLKVARQWDEVRFNTLVQWQNSDKQLPTTRNLQRDSAELETTSLRIQNQLDYQWHQWQMAHRFYFLSEQKRFLDRASTLGLEANDVSNDVQGYGLYSVLAQSVQNHDLTLGLDLQVQDVDVFDAIQDQQVFLAQRQSAVLALGDDWWLSPRWQLSTVYRHYWVDNKVEDSLSRLAAPTENHQGQSIQMGTRWQFNRQLSIRGNLGVVIRIPTMHEQFGWEGRFNGSPDLVREKAEVADLGMMIETQALQWTAALYAHRITDAVLTLYNSEGIGRAENAGTFNKMGFDTKLTWLPTHWLEASVQLSLLDSDNQSNIKAFKGKQIPSIYHQTYGAGIALQQPSFRFSVDVLRQEDMYYNSANAVKADDKTLVGSSFTYYWPQITFDLSAQNLIGKNHIDFNRMPTPGRSLTATLTLSF